MLPLSFIIRKNTEEIRNIESTITSKRFITLNLKNNNWNPMNYDLYVRVNIEYENGNSLYGPDGVAPLMSELSFGLEWYSQLAKKRGIINGAKISNSTSKKTIIFEHFFEKETFMYDIEFNLLVFMSKKAYKINENEDYLNNNEGVILGNVDKKILFMSGTGSLFPIYIQNLDANKLWDLQINFDDPSIDKLSDCVKLIINSNHSDYKLLDINNKKYCDRMIFEIVANAVTIIICHLKENGYLDRLEDSYSEGSIMEFVSYYHKILGLKVDSVLDISSSLRKYLEEKKE